MQGTIYAPSNNDDELMLDVQDGWWLNHTTTNLLLAVLVHRCNPDVIADPTTVRTGQTREILTVKKTRLKGEKGIVFWNITQRDVSMLRSRCLSLRHS
jgi:hypothetical protein